MTLQRVTIGLVWVSLLGLLALLAWAAFRASTSTAGSVGGTNWESRALTIRPRPAPDLRLALLPSPAIASNPPADQRELRLAALQGQPAVLNFWASWCQPCRQEAEVLERFAREYGPRGVTFLGVNVWDSEDKARAFVAEFGLSYPNGMDANGSAAVDYGLTGLPETFFMDRDGRLIRKFIGPITERALRAALEELIS